MATIRLGGVSLDCDEPSKLARFWAELLGGTIEFESDDFVAVKHGGGWLSTVRVPDYEPPTWPESTRAKQVHLELSVSDLDGAQATAIGLGAVVAATQPRPESWRVLLDPAGHPFCVTTLIP